MLIYDIINKKRQNQILTKEEIDFAVNGFIKNKIDEAEMSALLMAITINGLSFSETYNLTKSIQNSGETINFDFDVVDKHSTGGVSDSTTLILVPLLASLGLNVAKMSGKSLGHTGGTIDKLMIFDGYNYEISIKEFENIIKKTGGSLISQTKNIATADKKIYKLRDKTASVSSLPLIASSIMSKKLASGASTILLDVKYGKGALMPTKREAMKLAKYMVEIGKLDGKKVWAVITNMNMPLASGIGTAFEVYSVIKALKGEPSLMLEVTKELAANLLVMSKDYSYKVSREKVEQTLKSEVVTNKLKEIVSAHKGKTDVIDNPELILENKQHVVIKSDYSGYVSNIDALKLAGVVMELQNNVADIDKNYQGMLLNVKHGDFVQKGNELLKVYYDGKLSKKQRLTILQAFEFSNRKVKGIKLVEKIIRSN